MKFGVFFLCEQPPWQSQRSAYADALDQAFYADALGFDSVWLAEHHFSEYGTAPDVAVLAAALAQRVKRMRIGTAVSTLPFNHPIRSAESFVRCGVMAVSASHVRDSMSSAKIPAKRSARRILR